MPTFDFDGMPIAFDVAGEGEPVLFLHNLGADRRIWDRQMDALSRTHRVYALDWLGFGESAVPDSGYTLENYLRLLTAFVGAHDLAEVTLVGNCFGSAMSLLYARRDPRRVRAPGRPGGAGPRTSPPRRTRHLQARLLLPSHHHHLGWAEQCPVRRGRSPAQRHPRTAEGDRAAGLRPPRDDRGRRHRHRRDLLDRQARRPARVIGADRDASVPDHATRIGSGF
jgi:pimeloyl-ACP methyl ester carboxylesterase